MSHAGTFVHAPRGSLLTKGRRYKSPYTAISRSEKQAQSAGFELAWRSRGSHGELAHGGAFTDILLYGEQPQLEAGAKRRIRAGMAE